MMDRKIVPVKTYPIFKPSASERLLHRTVRKVQRWEDPLEADLGDLDQRLDETQAIVRVAMGPICYLPNGDQLPDEIEVLQASLTSIPSAAIGQLEKLSSSHCTKAQAAHLRLITQCDFLQTGRCHIRAAEGLLTERSFIDSMSGKAIVTQLRSSYHATYEWLTGRGIDGQALDSMLDASPVDLVAWLLEQRLYQALKMIYGVEWFRRHGLAAWLSEQQQVERAQDGLPSQPIGSEDVLFSDLTALHHAVFDTQIKAAALFGSLSLNWYISADVLVALLIYAERNLGISRWGGEKLVGALAMALESADKRKFDKVCQGLKRELGSVFD